MPTKTAMLMARFDPKIKKEAETIFRELGLTTSDAINLFFNQVRLRNGLPFEVTIPEQKEKRKQSKKEASAEN